MSQPTPHWCRMLQSLPILRQLQGAIWAYWMFLCRACGAGRSSSMTCWLRWWRTVWMTNCDRSIPATN